MFILIKHLKLNFAFEGMKTLAELVVIQNSLKSELTICKKKSVWNRNFTKNGWLNCFLWRC